MSRKTAVALPFRTLSSADVEALPRDGWQVHAGGGPPEGSVVVDGGHIESWDYLSDLVLRREFRFPEDLPERFGLGNHAPAFVLIVSVTTAGGMFRELMLRNEVRSGGGRLEVMIKPASARLSRDLAVVSTLSLAKGIPNAEALSPRLAGARLWEDSVYMRLEAGRGRLPMECVSFRSSFSGEGFEHAMCHVEVAPFPDLDVEETVRVYLNSDYPGFVDALQRREQGAELLLWESVVRRILTCLVLDDAVMPSAELPSSSLGANLTRWLAQAFPGMPGKDVRAMALTDPARFESIVQSWAGVARGAFAGTGS